MRFPWLAAGSPPPPPPPTRPPSPAVALYAAIAVATVAYARLYLRRRHTVTLTPAEASRRGVLFASILSFVSVSASAVTFPFFQSRRDALGCDALCQGGQTSLRSGLTLVGAALIGRASDRFGRLPMLWIGLAATLSSLLINVGMDSLAGMWYAIIPVALLNQNFSVSKALLTDYVEQAGGSKADVAGAVGKLGMAVGLSFMAGPLIATQLVTSYKQALALSAALTSFSAIFIILLPPPLDAANAPSSADVTTSTAASKPSASSTATAASKPTASQGSSISSEGLLAFVRMPVLQTRGAQLLMALRLLMAFAFHMWAPVWQVSIRERFDFQPQDHAKFMGVIGLTYAVSQGAVSKPLIRRAGRDPTKLLLLCVALLGGSRPFALYTSSMYVVYALYIPMVLALGVMNTAISAACSSLADGDQLGGLFGVLESVESVAGMIGPTLGGLAASVHPELPLYCVLFSYAMAFCLVSLFFAKHVVRAGEAKGEAKGATSEQTSSVVRATPSTLQATGREAKKVR